MFYQNDHVRPKRALSIFLLLMVISLLIYSIINQVRFPESYYSETLEEQHFSDDQSAMQEETHSNKYNIAVGIISAPRPAGAPEYVYSEVMSILDTLLVNPKYLSIDKIHIFDSAVNGSQVKFFKYSKHIQVHPMDPSVLHFVENKPVNAKASLNYWQGLKYLVSHYLHNPRQSPVQAILMLEDDVIFDPNAEYIIYRILKRLQNESMYLVDGYIHKGRVPTEDETTTFLTTTEEDPIVKYNQSAACCSQSFLLSPKAAEIAIPIIEKSLNGSEEYRPLDVHLSSSLIQLPHFTFYLSKLCWVQHIGFPYLGLGYFHRGCSQMNFEDS